MRSTRARPQWPCRVTAQVSAVFTGASVLLIVLVATRRSARAASPLPGPTTTDDTVKEVAR